MPQYIVTHVQQMRSISNNKITQLQPGKKKKKKKEKKLNIEYLDSFIFIFSYATMQVARLLLLVIFHHDHRRQLLLHVWRHGYASFFLGLLQPQLSLPTN
jgi:hypothetical protein